MCLSNMSNLKMLNDKCVLIRKCLLEKEQRLLYSAVCKAASQCNESSVTQSLKNTTTATKLMSINVANPEHKDRMSPIFMALQERIRDILSSQKILRVDHRLKEMFIKSLKYKSCNGRLDRHCDGIEGMVFLYSLGNTAMFFMNNTEFEFQSGDVLIFDSSWKAKLFHGITSIQSNTCPPHLAELKEHRISVQIRCQKKSKKRKVKSDKIEALMLKLDGLR